MQPQAKNLKDLQDIATANNIPIQFERRQKKEGWMDKPKGMLQLLYERGFLTLRKRLPYSSIGLSNWAYELNARPNITLKLRVRELSTVGD